MAKRAVRGQLWAHKRQFMTKCVETLGVLGVSFPGTYPNFLSVTQRLCFRRRLLTEENTQTETSERPVWPFSFP